MAQGTGTQQSTGTNQQNQQTNLPQSNGGAEAAEHTEGPIARAIEEQTAKLPSDVFLWAAVGAIGASFILEVAGKEEKSRFVGQWVAPFMLLGVYNKLVKIGGSDRLSR
jgi:hypothetical protein